MRNCLYAVAACVLLLVGFELKSCVDCAAANQTYGYDCSNAVNCEREAR